MGVPCKFPLDGISGDSIPASKWLAARKIWEISSTNQKAGPDPRESHGLAADRLSFLNAKIIFFLLLPSLRCWNHGIYWMPRNHGIVSRKEDINKPPKFQGRSAGHVYIWVKPWFPVDSQTKSIHLIFERSKSAEHP